MPFIADLQIHSRYAQACSKQTTLKLLEQYARIKGIYLLGTGDFQHPEWRKEIDRELKEDEHGILWSRTGFPFLWQTEISLIYTQGGKGRRVHHLLYAPNKEIATQMTEALGKKGRLDYDGRPIFGFSSIELVDMMRSISSDIEIIPAHAFTPWFSVFGSKSGFDSLKECFEDKAKYIHAIETGMSSDPAMNWRISALDNTQLVSFSDAHSYWPWRLGREATIFEGEMTYKNILHAIRTGEGLAGTIEVQPHYGKYHFDGHRACNVVLTPAETKKVQGICPVCKRPLTIGVQYRVDELADRPDGYKPKNAKPFKNSIPLSEILAMTLQSGIATKKVWDLYNVLIRTFGSEFSVLFDANLTKIEQLAGSTVSKILALSREGKLQIEPGYDGVYGKLILGGQILQPKDDEGPKKTPPPQKKLTDF